MSKALTKLAKSFAGQSRTLAIPLTYIELCGNDHIAALLLSQILYWTERTDDPEGWFAKSYEDWNRELLLTEYQVRRAIGGDKRSKSGFNGLYQFGVETKLERSNFYKGAATLHYRINDDVFEKALLNYVTSTPPTMSRTGVNNVQNDVPDNVKSTPPTMSETYTENMQEITTERELPPHLRNFQLQNNGTPLIDAYLEAHRELGKRAPIIKHKSHTDYELEGDLARAGYTPEQVKACTLEKLKDKPGYALHFLRSDLPTFVNAQDKPKPKTTGTDLTALGDSSTWGPEQWAQYNQLMREGQS